MTYLAKIPFALYELHFHQPQGGTTQTHPVKIIIEFEEKNKLGMNLKWRCPKF